MPAVLHQISDLRLNGIVKGKLLPIASHSKNLRHDDGKACLDSAELTVYRSAGSTDKEPADERRESPIS